MVNCPFFPNLGKENRPLFPFPYFKASLHLWHIVGFSLSCPTVISYFQHLSHFSPSATCTFMSDVPSTKSNPDTMNTSFSKSLLSFKNLYSSPSADIITFAFSECPLLFSLFYGGTKLEWNKIRKGESWSGNIKEIQCTDGIIEFD